MKRRKFAATGFVIGLLFVGAATLASKTAAAHCSGFACDHLPPSNGGCNASGNQFAVCHSYVYNSAGANIGTTILYFSTLCGTAHNGTVSNVGTVGYITAEVLRLGCNGADPNGVDKRTFYNTTSAYSYMLFDDSPCYC